MSQRARRLLQFVCGSQILVLGATLAWLCRGQGPALACVFGLMAIGLVAVAISELAFPGGASAGKSPAASARADRELDAAIESLGDAIRRHVGHNHEYKGALQGFNDELAKFPPRDEVREIIVELMNANFETQAKVVGLSKELATARRQIVSLRSSISEVGKIAMLDALTRLGNRRYFDDALGEEIARARASGHELCLAMADIDRFKQVNDRFGHVVGDHLLRMYGEMLARAVAGKGLAARYGGEEFALLFPKFGLDETKRVIEGLRGELASKSWVVGAKQERLGVVTASFGIARLEPDEAAEHFVERADDKLMEAKSAGRNRVAVDWAAARIRLAAQN